MAIARENPNLIDDRKTEIKIIEQVIAPVLSAAKKFYQTNPKEFLELILFLIYLVLTLIGEIVVRLPWTWYLVFCVFMIGYFNFPENLKKILKKGKRK